MSAAVYDPALRAGLRLLSAPGPEGRLSIVIFHRVFEHIDPIFPDDPDTRRFDVICGWLRRWFNVLPLDEAVRRRAAGKLPARALAITFDDGYADNHDLALPVLRRHGLTATFFIATGFLNGGRMWNDTVIEALRRCPVERLDLRALGLPGIGELDLSNPDARRAATHRLLGPIKYLAYSERLACVERLAAMVGVELPSNLMMTSAQVQAMAAAGMQIGAHTVSHPILARLPDAQAREEIVRSRDDLQALLGRPVTLFAYPNGKPGADYLPRDAAVVRELGFEAAVSTVTGAARASTAAHELPRFTPWDRGRLPFGLRLARNLMQS